MKTELQKFEMVTVRRSDLREHPKNPRVITDSAKKKLKDKMRKVGLLQPIIVNRRPDGALYVLGGHQRLATMDGLERYKSGKTDYELDVAMVCISEAEELEMLVFLNNPSASGSWNTELLAEINQDLGIDFGDMGFDKIDVDLLFDGDSRFSDMFTDPADVEEVKDGLREIKEARKAGKERMDERQNGNFYLVVACADEAEKIKLMQALHLPKYEMYASAECVLQAVEK